ncbi:hypothetical protein HEP87_58715 [Streptomyces sp. S1D4-11]
MSLGGGLGWLRARDPGLWAVHRSARVTLVACTGCYAARYGLGNHVAAVYALFGAIASGGMSFVPGTPRERARTLLAALLVAAVPVTLGTVLGVHSWTAALGMLGVGFLVTYAGVGGPRVGAGGQPPGVLHSGVLSAVRPGDAGGAPGRAGDRDGTDGGGGGVAA